MFKSYSGLAKKGLKIHIETKNYLISKKFFFSEKSLQKIICTHNRCVYDDTFTALVTPQLPVSRFNFSTLLIML